MSIEGQGHFLTLAWKYADADNQLSLLRYVSIEGQGHFLTLAQGRLRMKIKTCFSHKPLGLFNQIVYESF